MLREGCSPRRSPSTAVEPVKMDLLFKRVLSEVPGDSDQSCSLCEPRCRRSVLPQKLISQSLGRHREVAGGTA